MSKLHEVLAVESELAGVAKNVRDEAVTTFIKKEHMFKGGVRRLTMFAEGRKSEEAAGAQDMAVTESAMPKLQYVLQAQVKYWDAVLQKEEANQRAKSDLVIELEDGSSVTLAKDVPATFLLGLEAKLTSLRPVIEAIPTLPAGINWEPDTTQVLPGVFKRVPDVVTDKTEKIIKPFVLSPATDKHPAQVEKLSVDQVIGRFTQTEFCSGLSPHAKSVLLGRLDTLLRGVKAARQRANCEEVKNLGIGKALVDFLQGK